jgi:hypothetical protein
MRRALRVFLVAFLLVPLLGAAAPKDLAARWHGFWTAPEGWIYEADVVLTVDASNQVSGPIQWTLIKSPRPAEQGKLGLKGIEHVRGVFLPEAGVVRLEGWSLEDTNKILGMDKYRLVLSDDGKVLGGITFHHGPWNAQILLLRE